MRRLPRSFRCSPRPNGNFVSLVQPGLEARHVSDNAATVRQIQTNASTSAISPILPINTYLFTALRPDTLAMG
jgi:hypothetical protein